MITIVSGITGFVTFIITRRTNSIKYGIEKGKREAEINKDIVYLVEAVSRIEENIKEANITELKTLTTINSKEIENIKQWQLKHEESQSKTFDRMFGELKEIKDLIRK